MWGGRGRRRSLTTVGCGVAQVFHDLLVELQLLLVAEVEEGKRRRTGGRRRGKRRKSSRRDNKHVDGHDDGREWSADKARTSANVSMDEVYTRNKTVRARSQWMYL